MSHFSILASLLPPSGMAASTAGSTFSDVATSLRYSFSISFALEIFDESFWADDGFSLKNGVLTGMSLIIEGVPSTSGVVVFSATGSMVVAAYSTGFSSATISIAAVTGSFGGVLASIFSLLESGDYSFLELPDDGSTFLSSSPFADSKLVISAWVLFFESESSSFVLSSWASGMAIGSVFSVTVADSSASGLSARS